VRPLQMRSMLTRSEGGVPSSITTRPLSMIGRCSSGCKGGICRLGVVGDVVVGLGTEVVVVPVEPVPDPGLPPPLCANTSAGLNRTVTMIRAAKELIAHPKKVGVGQRIGGDRTVRKRSTSPSLLMES